MSFKTKIFFMMICAFGQMLAQDHSVSFIYYPRCSSCPIVGHAEVEVNGRSHTLLTSIHYSKNLPGMIEKSERDGKPFFRFVFRATQKQAEDAERFIETNKDKYSVTCAYGALAPLQASGLCSIPSPFRVSPLLSALYLTAGKKLGFSDIEEIEYYGSSSMSKDAAKMSLGVAGEAANIWSLAVIGHATLRFFGVFRKALVRR